MISAADLPLTRLRPGLSATAHRPATPAGGRSDEWSGREDLNLRLHGPEPCALPGCATPRHDGPIVQNRQASQAYFPTSFTNLHSPQRRVFISPPIFSTTVSVWFTASPTGTIMRPPSPSCWKSGGGTDGPPAVTRILSNGASSGQPSVPLPTRTQTLSQPSSSSSARARSASRGR